MQITITGASQETVDKFAFGFTTIELKRKSCGDLSHHEVPGNITKKL